MKKVLLSLTTLALLGTSAAGLAAQIVIKETPIVIKREGEVYMVPAGTSGNYYYYTTEDKTEYVCSSVTAPDLADVKFLPLNVSVGTEVREVRCYPSSSFVIQP